MGVRKRGHIDSFAQYIEAVQGWVEDAREASGGTQPLFLLGHSLGGLIAVRYVQSLGYTEQSRGCAWQSAGYLEQLAVQQAEQSAAQPAGLTGLTLTSPCLARKVQIPPWKVRLAQWLDRAWPTLIMPNGIRADMVSRDEAVQAAYRSDPLNYAKVSVRWFQELQRAMEAAWKDREGLSLPILIHQAGDDALIVVDAVERFAAGLSSAEFHRWPGLRHEVLNEPEREQVMRQMEAWMNRVAS